MLELTRTTSKHPYKKKRHVRKGRQGLGVWKLAASNIISDMPFPGQSSRDAAQCIYLDTSVSAYIFNR